MGATITSSGQWTQLATDLTKLEDTYYRNPAPSGAPALAFGTLPPFDANDMRNLPDELLKFIQLAAQGLGASYFNGAAPTVGTTRNLDVKATALMIYMMLGAYLRRGLPGHDGLGARGVPA